MNAESEILAKAQLLVAMHKNQSVEEVEKLCAGYNLEALYFACVQTDYEHADALLAGQTGDEKQILLYRISLADVVAAKALIAEYKEKFGTDAEIVRAKNLI
jgi:hypothetical protein